MPEPHKRDFTADFSIFAVLSANTTWITNTGR